MSSGSDAFISSLPIPWLCFSFVRKADFTYTHLSPNNGENHLLHNPCVPQIPAWRRVVHPLAWWCKASGWLAMMKMWYHSRLCPDPGFILWLQLFFFPPLPLGEVEGEQGESREETLPDPASEIMFDMPQRWENSALRGYSKIRCSVCFSV